MNAMVLFTTEVFGVLLRVLGCQGKRWLSSEDIARVFEYRSADSVRNVVYRHALELKPCSIKAKINSNGQAVRLIDEKGLRYFCEYSPRPGALHLLRWLDAGGLQAECDDKIPFDGVPIKPDSAVAFETKPVDEKALEKTIEEAVKSGKLLNDSMVAWARELGKKDMALLNGYLEAAVKTNSGKVLSLVKAAADKQKGTRKASYVPLYADSQAGARKVFFFDENATTQDLMDNASFRLESTLDLLHAVACGSTDDPKAATSIACSCSVLLSDATSLVDVLFDRLYRYENPDFK